ncbi:LytR C-terminal domain-containing protein [Antribacter gilvus]|uniref:LytR C-terminal domain-containing protein n=1 Tax=Antribacter gilvus TaxID=2304675 RepID=UPI0013E0E0DF|nr:LytR C-terminal domain-containing protein [Antribacter gilvus]
MTVPTYDQARTDRRRREHERQAVIFGVLIAILALCGIFSLAVYSGAMSSPFDKPLKSPDTGAAALPAPCLPAVEGQPDGALPVAYPDVQVRVLNASGEAGVAKAYHDVLVERQFTMLADPGNSDRKLTITELRFGVPGITAAYTLWAHVPDARLVLDSRQDATVDLLPGAEFEAPVAEEDVQISADRPLENAPGCLPPEEITPQPAPAAAG